LIVLHAEKVAASHAKAEAQRIREERRANRRRFAEKASTRSPSLEGQGAGRQVATLICDKLASRPP